MNNLDEKEMLEYVRNYLVSNNNDISIKPNQGFRSRYEHTKRVLDRVKYLIKKENIAVNKEILLIATIFHDVGRSTTLSNNLHGERGAQIFRDYAKNKKMDNDMIEEICYLIETHPQKHLLKEKDIKNELIILQEADLLDETGAMGIVFDCMYVGALNSKDYEEAYKSITRFSARILQGNPMVTPVAYKIWEEKQKLINDFIHQLEIDLGY